METILTENPNRFTIFPLKYPDLWELYKKAGVNPLGGCLPMLLQMPILIAMFRFFPAKTIKFNFIFL